MSSTRRDPLLLDLALPMAGVAAALPAVLLALTGADPRSAWPLGLLLALTVLVAMAARPPTATGIGVISWLFLDGFIVNTAGELTLHRADLVSLATLACAGLVVSGVASAIRRLRAGPVHLTLRTRSLSPEARWRWRWHSLPTASALHMAKPAAPTSRVDRHSPAAPRTRS
ncbi:hypothetical protein ACFYYR_30975 [Streptomyces sp. NPDC001922]|uniref:hypothetical protein n=1 Tax=Streptomyces sp. NPDC001922 TaxID=3364624 RepID=UPI0036AC19F7